MQSLKVIDKQGCETFYECVRDVQIFGESSLLKCVPLHVFSLDKNPPKYKVIQRNTGDFVCILDDDKLEKLLIGYKDIDDLNDNFPKCVTFMIPGERYWLFRSVFYTDIEHTCIDDKEEHPIGSVLSVSYDSINNNNDMKCRVKDVYYSPNHDGSYSKFYNLSYEFSVPVEFMDDRCKNYHSYKSIKDRIDESVNFIETGSKYTHDHKGNLLSTGDRQTLIRNIVIAQLKVNGSIPNDYSYEINTSESD